MLKTEALYQAEQNQKQDQISRLKQAEQEHLNRIAEIEARLRTQKKRI